MLGLFHISVCKPNFSCLLFDRSYVRCDRSLLELALAAGSVAAAVSGRRRRRSAAAPGSGRRAAGGLPDVSRRSSSPRAGGCRWILPFPVPTLADSPISHSGCLVRAGQVSKPLTRVSRLQLHMAKKMHSHRQNILPRTLIHQCTNIHTRKHIHTNVTHTRAHASRLAHATHIPQTAGAAAGAAEKLRIFE